MERQRKMQHHALMRFLRSRYEYQGYKIRPPASGGEQQRIVIARGLK